MKRLFLSFIAAMMLTCGYAKNVNRYDLDFNDRSMHRLAAKLDLTYEQEEAMCVVQENFNNAVLEAGESEWFKRRPMMHKAIMGNVKQSKKILNEQ